MGLFSGNGITNKDLYPVDEPILHINADIGDWNPFHFTDSFLMPFHYEDVTLRSNENAIPV